MVGSRFEWQNIKSKEFDFLTERSALTDDSIMTLAVGRAILACEGDYDKLGALAVHFMREMGRAYPDRGYGGMFRDWLYSDDPHPYGSFGNGAAMRVSACGFAAGSLDEARALSRKVTEVTHDHPEGIRGAEATATAIFLARAGESLADIRDVIHARYYPMDFTLDEIRDTYSFDVSCQGSVPQAIQAFLESTCFEDAIRNAISLGGDSDTIGAITGGIAHAYYGIPDAIREQVLPHIEKEASLHDILLTFEARFLSPVPSGGMSPIFVNR
jgi:type I restriction enzyme M protein